ncbi:RNA-binding protein 5-B [Zancudomyces culisetae]|uniref:RNA-binding protein 5-B n=1 Tax=Zancudomyces culisetae TaxID=1213189 RepID=A0A1R1PVV2_ZANCU|nr:RNA-binding protein 5-B [Zancudomyces culisetae]|eukprot:OMH85096.1 RNA-binding protein 5-B [Zancudomyces culisetae]
MKLRHLDEVGIGGTTFQVHIHDLFPCSACSLSRATNNTLSNDAFGATVMESEPVITTLPKKQLLQTQRIVSIEAQRREELARLKSKYKVTKSSKDGYGNSGSVGVDVRDTPSETADDKPDYLDRAAIRRSLNPEGTHKPTFDMVSGTSLTAHCGMEKSSVHTHIDSANVGYGMLSKMGWERGKGLGTKQDGIVAPVMSYISEERRGLGARLNIPLTDDFDGVKKTTNAYKDSQITRKRYYNTQK